MDTAEDEKGKSFGPGRLRDPVWGLFTVIQGPGPGRKPSGAYCKLCEKLVSPKVERLRAHLERFHADVDVSSGADFDGGLDSSTLNPNSEENKIEMVEQSSISSLTNSNEIAELNFVVKHETKVSQDPEMKNVPLEEKTMMDDETESMDFEIPEERDLILKYFTTENEAEVKCNLCDLRMSPGTTELIDHLFDFHTSTFDTLSKELGLEENDLQNSRHSKAKTAFQFCEAGRSRSSVWRHFDRVIVEFENKRSMPKVKCKLCEQIVSRKVERLRRHLLHFHLDAVDKETEERFLCSKEAQKVSARSILRRKKGIHATSLVIAKPKKKESERKGGKSRIWSYFKIIPKRNTCRGFSTWCKICHENVSPKIERLKNHFAHFHPDVDVELTDGTFLDTENAAAPATENGAPIAQVQEDSNKWVWKYFDRREDDGRKAQCRLCLDDLCDPESDLLHQHLKNTHPGILEFCDDDYDDGHTANPNDDEDGPSETVQRRKVRNAKEDTGKCLLCENGVSEFSSSSSSFVTWDLHCAESLCEVFGLDGAYSAYFEAGKYCPLCQDLVRNIDFTQRALKKMNTLLTSYRVSYEKLLRKEYERQVHGSRSSRNPKRDTRILKKLHDVIVSQDAGAVGSGTETGEDPSENENRHVRKRRSERSRLSGVEVDEPVEKTSEVIKYTWKYGRASTRINLFEQDPDSEVESESANNGTEQTPDDFPGNNTSILNGKTSNIRQKLNCKEAGCNFSTWRKAWLDVHVRSRHRGCGAEGRLHLCPRCGRNFGCKKSLGKHWKDVHSKMGPSREVTVCGFCSLAVKCGGQGLSEHEKQHEMKVTERLPFGCVLCDSQVFTNSVDLKSHVKHVHNPSSHHLKCDKCQKTFMSQEILRRHRKIVHSEMRISLERGTVGENGMEQVTHVRKHHHGPRAFLCAECGATFLTKGQLRVHTRLHTGEKPWRCKFCPKGFNQTSKLKAHEETHVPTKTYDCDKCGKSFRTARNIYQHQRFHCHPELVGGDQKRRTKEECHKYSTNSLKEDSQGSGSEEGVCNVHVQGHDDGIPLHPVRDSGHPIWIQRDSEQELAVLGLVD